MIAETLPHRRAWWNFSLHNVRLLHFPDCLLFGGQSGVFMFVIVRALVTVRHIAAKYVWILLRFLRGRGKIYRAGLQAVIISFVHKRIPVVVKYDKRWILLIKNKMKMKKAS